MGWCDRLVVLGSYVGLCVSLYSNDENKCRETLLRCALDVLKSMPAGSVDLSACLADDVR
jgi:hypothetical protein